MHSDLDISVLIATYNRSEMLRQTLEAMSRLNWEGLSLEFVVVDNNSLDNTREVVESFAEQLPVRYLFEPHPGKNYALNRALDEVDLGKIVVFTDDDVVPKEDWLRSIVATCERWPACSVFGGKVDVVWPQVEIPEWAKRNKDIQTFTFGRHDKGDSDCRYPPEESPLGANFWVRQEIFDEGRRYDVSIGPRPGSSYRMGSETSFLRQLVADGYDIMYSPEAVVGHHVQPAQLEESAVRKRAFRLGFGWAHLIGPTHIELLEKHPGMWRCLRVVSIVRDSIRYVWARVSFPRQKRFERSVYVSRWLAYNIESFRIANGIGKKQ